MWSLEYALAGAPEQRGSLCCQCACESWRQIAHCLSQELNQAPPEMACSPGITAIAQEHALDQSCKVCALV